MKPRVGIEWLQERLPHSKRALQAMAARGDIPSAAKIGALWTFEPDAIGAWIERLEADLKARRRKDTLRTAPNPWSPTVRHSQKETREIDEAFERLFGPSTRRPRLRPK